ncbi:MAG TPA: FecR domain-containing protein [Polyangiales bacterium]|nr:FecR domain-containing protein [Polyangiales bacterium]
MNAAGRPRPAGYERPRWTWLWLCLACLLACAKSCSCGDAFLAQLQTYKGEVQRDEARAVNAWSEVANGERFHMGDGLRTGKLGSAQLSLAGSGVALVESNTVLRFVDRDPRGKSRFDLEAGAVRIDSGDFDIDIDTPRGIARLGKSTSVRILSNDDETQFDVLVGQVAIDQSGTVEQLTAGQQLTVKGDEKLADAVGEDAGSDAVSAPKTAAAARPVTGATGPQTAELSMPELDSMTLHAPSLPVTFRVQSPACKADKNEHPNADLDGKAATPESGGNGLLLSLARPGAHRLNLRCDRRLVRQTTLHVIRDAATMELPKSANRVDVEADGRRYTVKYQNVIPVVSMKWSDAAPRGDYTLVLKRGSREQTYRSEKPSRDLPGLELAEGNYDFWFTSASGQKSSVGGLRIEFDNTARALSLSEPVDGASAEGNEVVVSGVALLRTQVTANGVPLALDPKGRFRAQVALNAERSVLVRAIHPSAGVHYYLRRLH